MALDNLSCLSLETNSVPGVRLNDKDVGLFVEDPRDCFFGEITYCLARLLLEEGDSTAVDDEVCSSMIVATIFI
jgi:hypothetical protein